MKNLIIQIFIEMNISKSTPYTTREKVLLAQLVDGATLGEKNKAWQSITTTYNCQPEVSNPQTVGQLRKLWNNLKQ